MRTRRPGNGFRQEAVSGDWRRRVCGVCLVLMAGAFGERAEARVFVLTKESFASYLAFSTGTSAIGKNPYLNESTATGYSAGIDTNMSGEFGFVATGGLINWRFGFEVFKPTSVTATASNGGSDLYAVTSAVTGFIPKLGIEVNLRTTSWYRFLLFGTFGQAHVTVRNDYSSVTIAPNADFTAEYKGNAAFSSTGLGVEAAAFDTTTVLLEIGYRKAFIDNLTYAKDVTGFNGAHAAGDDVLWTDGARREIDLTGVFVSVGARFWLF